MLYYFVALLPHCFRALLFYCFNVLLSYRFAAFLVYCFTGVASQDQFSSPVEIDQNMQLSVNEAHVLGLRKATQLVVVLCSGV